MRRSIIFGAFMGKTRIVHVAKKSYKISVARDAYMTSLMLAMVSVPSAMAVNETTQGTVTGTETWSGTINLQGDIEVAEGSKLIVNAGTTVNVPAGNFIDVRGAICIGDTACGASGGSSSSQEQFIWSTPTDDTKTGRCYDSQTTF